MFFLANMVCISICHKLSSILLPFDPRMTSLALLEREITYPLDITGKKNVDVFLPSIVAVIAFPLCMDVVEVMVVWMVQFLNKR